MAWPNSAEEAQESVNAEAEATLHDELATIPFGEYLALKQQRDDLLFSLKACWPYLLEYDRLLRQQRTVAPNFVHAVETAGAALRKAKEKETP